MNLDEKIVTRAKIANNATTKHTLFYSFVTSEFVGTIKNIILAIAKPIKGRIVAYTIVKIVLSLTNHL